MTRIVTQASSGRRSKSERAMWGTILLAWFLVLWFVPDPRPLGAPELSVKAVRAVSGLPEPAARAGATLLLRGAGLGLLGVLVALSLSSVRMSRAAPAAVIGAPLLGIASQWLNYGYFPIDAQIQLCVAATVLGSLAGLSLRRGRAAVVAFLVVGGGLFVWGTSTGISDELDGAARITGLHVLRHADEIPDGDEGFAELVRLAFEFAEDNSHGTDAVLPNQAAILAIGVIVGDERVAQVAGRLIDPARRAEFAALRSRVTLRGRNDLARHFSVSAALTILSDEDRSMTVGIAKEMMDATPGGSGFSFVDLTADRAGNLFAVSATSSEESARAMQRRIRSGLDAADYCPDIEGLPEGMSRDEFQTSYGGLGGPGTASVVEEIRRRLSTCRGLSNPVTEG